MISLRATLGIDRRPSSWRDQFVSGAGGLVAILAVYWLSATIVGDSGVFLVASMGASAVLLFAVPHGPLSQPWQLVMGHLVSALAGVACARHLPDPMLAGALAVGGSILLMRTFGCVHPPGGATALSAVVGGPAVAELGYGFVVTPVLLNVAVMLAVAFVVNYPFTWRRYPAALQPNLPGDTPGGPPDIAHADLVYALSEIDTFIDVSEHDLLRVYELAMRHQATAAAAPLTDIRPGRYYSNGRYGADWQVREVLDIQAVGAEGRKIVSFCVAAGTGRRRTGKCGLLEFTRWARHEVERNENSWQRTGNRPRTLRSAIDSPFGPNQSSKGLTGR